MLTNHRPRFARSSARAGRLNQSDAQEKNKTLQNKTHVGARAHYVRHGPKIQNTQIFERTSNQTINSPQAVAKAVKVLQDV